MRTILLIQVVGALLGLALASPFHSREIKSSATTTSRGHVLLAQLFPKDFLLTDVHARSAKSCDGNLTASAACQTSSTFNETLTFNFTDLNTNTSTICSKSWKRDANATVEPSPSFDLCDDTHIQYETYRWRFEETPTIFGTFVIELAHSFYDPIDFPEPYSVPTFFSTRFHFNLTCSHQREKTSCTLPTAQSPLHAPVNAMID
ncbi:hypothetical protein B0J14DRAFT_648298 [Halenospora varia]|nr:hypothetical protein B0J14DRAFT_648298 [Halenospora varia]